MEKSQRVAILNPQPRVNSQDMRIVKILAKLIGGGGSAAGVTFTIVKIWKACFDSSNQTLKPKDIPDVIIAMVENVLKPSGK